MINSVYTLYRNSFGGLSRPVWLLAAVTMINRSGTMVIPFLTVYLTQERDFTLQQTGWVMTFFGIGSVLGTYIGGQLTDKIGYYPVQFWSLMLSGWMFMFVQYAESLFEWCLLIFVLSTIADAFRPANMASVAVYSKPKNRTRSISLIRLAINMGWAIGPAVGGFLAATVGYKWLFWADGLTCIAASIFFLIALPKKDIAKHIEEEDPNATYHSSVYKDTHFLIFVTLNAIGAIAFFQLFNTLPVYYKENLSMNEATIGGIMALNGLLIALLEMPAVFLMETRYRILRIIVAGTVLIGLSYFVLNLTSWVGIALISMLIITVGEIFTMPFANAFSLARANPASRGRYLALYGISYSVAFILAPLLGMQIAGSFGFATLWYFMALLSVLTGVGFWHLSKKV